MSGGTLNYNPGCLEEAISNIEERIFNNGKSLNQIWEERGEEMDEFAAGWFKPWTILDHPYYVEDIASDAAYTAIGKPRGSSFSFLTKKEIDEWNDIRKKEIKKQIDEHNNSTDGPVYTKKTIAEFKKGIKAIRSALVYLHAIDYLLSGDDGEESFHARLKEDLEKIKNGK